MSVPIIYKNTEYIATKHNFKTIIDNDTCNVMTIINGNIGFNTSFPLNTFHIEGNSYFNDYIGIGTSIPKAGLDIIGGNVIINGNLGIGTTKPLLSLHVENHSYFEGNVGIGTILPLKPFHVHSDTYFKGNIGIGTTIPLRILHVNGDIMSPIFIGQISWFAKTTAPIGWLKCDGSTISRTNYNQLFNVISTNFGIGDGSTTFRIPDLRGEFIRSWDDSRGIDVDRSFGSIQLDAIVNHTHTGTVSGSTTLGGAHSHTYTRYGSIPSTGGYAGSGEDWSGTTNATTSSAGTHTHPFSISVTTGNPSIGGSTETRPTNIALLACIKY